MIVKDIAQSREMGGTSPRQTNKLIFDEECSLCTRAIPEGSLVLRHESTKNMICLICLAEIAEIEP